MNQAELSLRAKKVAEELNADYIGTEHVLCALLENDDNARNILQTQKINPTNIISDIRANRKAFIRCDTPLKLTESAAKILNNGVPSLDIIAQSTSLAGNILKSAGYGRSQQDKDLLSQTNPHASKSTKMLDMFSVDYTKLAEQGKLDPVIGRTFEVERIIEILCRKKKNNPVLLGEAGVGKTAVVEGLAQRIVKNEVPPELMGHRVVSLDITSMVAGTQYRGMFEERMKAVLEELKNNSKVILFIDEMHTIIGAGSAQGTGDSANIMKPALARGELRAIGATTFQEYKKHIEKDPALERRFQKIIVEEPSIEYTKEIVEKSASSYETFHKVSYTAEALDSIISLSGRYLPERHFPDKAIDLVDELGSAAKIAKRQTVTEEDVQGLVSKLTGIPLTTISANDTIKLKNMEQNLCTKLIGQHAAVTKITQAIKRSRAGVRTGNKPISLMFTGKTGVGKTEAAKILAEELFGDKDALIRFDMSEFSEKFTSSRLVGAPPGYVGYDEGGQLTEKVRRRPYSIVLFDEIEKANKDVFNLLLQVLDEGFMKDASDRRVDFRNCIIILTSNVGAVELSKAPIGFGTDNNTAAKQEMFDKALNAKFPPEFLNRIDAIVNFNKLTRENLEQILHLMLKTYPVKIQLDQPTVQFLLNKAEVDKYGARPLKRLLQDEIEPLIADFRLDAPTADSFTINLIDNNLKVAINIC